MERAIDRSKNRERRMEIAIAGPKSKPAALAKFFVKNLTTEYISHSELQGYRAVRPCKWAKNIARVLEGEIADRLSRPGGHRARVGQWKGAIEGKEGTRLVAPAPVAPTPRAAA